MKTYPFTYERMQFELVRTDYNDAYVKMLGECNRIILYSLPGDITLDQAINRLQGFFTGYDVALQHCRQGINTVCDNSYFRQYYGVTSAQQEKK